MTLLDVLNIHETIREIIEKETGTDYRLKFRLLGILHELDNPVKNFERIRNEKIREYGKEDEEGNISIDPKDTDTLEKFNQDMQKLLLEEIHVTISRLQAADIFDSGLDTRYLVELYPVMDAE